MTGAIANLWPSLGTIDQYMDFTQILTFGHTFLSGKVFYLFMTGELSTQAFVIAGVLIMLVATYAVSAYVAVCTVQAAVHFSRGFYFNYADYSIMGNLMWFFELFLVGGWEFWSFAQIIFVTVSAFLVWDGLDARIAEAKAGSIGLENALTWGLAIKTFTLEMIVTIAMIIAGVCLGDVADEAIAWNDWYDDDTDKEGTDKETGKKDPAGTSATWDVLLHFVTAILSMAVFGFLGIFSYFFLWFELNLGDDGFQCDLDAVDNSVYAEV